jgi:hypothetical protein
MLPSLLGDPQGKRQRSIRVLRECPALTVWVNVVKSADLTEPQASLQHFSACPENAGGAFTSGSQLCVRAQL